MTWQESAISRTHSVVAVKTVDGVDDFRWDFKQYPTLISNYYSASAETPVNEANHLCGHLASMKVFKYIRIY